MAGSLPLKKDVQLVTQFPQSRRQALDVLSAAESVLPISDSEVTCGPMTRPATLNSSATSSSNSTDFSSSSSNVDSHRTSHPADEKSCLKVAWSESREHFLRLRKFCHSKSLVYRWYTQLDRRRFVYDTHRTMKATWPRHGWVHIFITHCSTVTVQLHNFVCSRLVVQVVSALLRGNSRDFNWHDASRGPSAIAELLVVKHSLNR